MQNCVDFTLSLTKVCLHLSGFLLYFFSPGHYGLSVSLKDSFKEADIQRLYPNEQLSSFLTIRKMLFKKACITSIEVDNLKLEHSAGKLGFFKSFGPLLKNKT